MLRRFNSGKFPRTQRGFSLVELSVAMLIALFLLGGLITMLMGTRRTSGTQTAMSQLQDNERIAMTLITNVVQKSGYFPYPATTETINSFPAETLSAVAFTSAQPMSGNYNAAAPGDTLGIRYFAPASDNAGAIINCAGQSNTSALATLEYANVFRVASVSGVWWLQCRTRSNNVGALSAVQTVNLIPNVTNMTVLYGVSSLTAGTTNAVVRYLNAADVTAAGAWPNVTCVKVTLTFLLPQYGTTGGQMMSSAAAGSTTTFQRVIPVMSRVGANFT